MKSFVSSEKIKVVLVGTSNILNLRFFSETYIKRKEMRALSLSGKLSEFKAEPEVVCIGIFCLCSSNTNIDCSPFDMFRISKHVILSMTDETNTVDLGELYILLFQNM